MRIHEIESDALGTTVQVAVFGHVGKPTLLFPPASGDALEVDRRGLVGACAHLLEAGRVKLYSVPTVAADTWMNKSASPEERAERQAAYDAFLATELLPWIREDCGDTEQPFAAAGASFGAYQAVNSVCKHPDWFDLCVAVSGVYNFDRWMGELRNDDYYFNQPRYFLPNLGMGEQREQLRKALFVMASGQGRWEAPHETDEMAKVLRAAGAHVSLELWGKDIDHDWPTWRQMIPLFLSRSC